MKKLLKAISKPREARMNIPLNVKCTLWGRAAGRCEICNCELDYDSLTLTKMNNSNIAHIVAESPDGPRGDKKRSQLLQTNIDNLMLLCPEHHKLIDEHPELYSEQDLILLKKRHEERIRKAGSVSEDQKRAVLFYSAAIGPIQPTINFEDAQHAMFYKYYPLKDSAIELGNADNPPFDDSQAQYWSYMSDSLRKSYQTKIGNLSSAEKANGFCVFAIAPQPLLVLLGTLVHDINKIALFQLHRGPLGWKWPEEDSKEKFIIKKPSTINQDLPPVLVLSISANITERIIKRYDKEGLNLWEVTVANPNVNFLQSESQLEMFHKLIPTLLDEIKNAGNWDALSVYMAMPNSLSIMFGMSWMPKAHLPMLLFDYNHSKGGDIETIKIQ